MTKFLMLLLGLLVFSGCAASPDVVNYVDKSVTIYADEADVVNLDYESNAEVTVSPKLDGTVSPNTTIKPPVF